MANIKKSFNFRNGVQVDNDNFVVNPNGLVGIGSTVPREFLDVRGNVIIDGTLTVGSINSAILSVTNPTFTTVNVGITSITSGIISATSGIVTYYGDGGKLLNLPTSQWIDVDSGFGYTSIYSAGNVGIATTNPVFTFQVGRNPIVSDGIGISSNGNVYSSGIITATRFVGIVTGNVTGDITGNINSSGISTFSTLKVGTAVTISDGIVTATTFVGGLEGNVTGNVTGNIYSSGISTFSTLKVGTGVTINGGIVTATTFVGALSGTATSTTNVPNLTGAITSNNTTTSLGSFTSAQLATALSDETGSGANVFATSPTLVTPTLGSATATSIIVGSGVTINSEGIVASAGIITAFGFNGALTGSVVGIASTARDLTSDARVSIAHVASQTSSIGISTVSTRLYAESIGIGTNSPVSDITVRRNGAAEIQVISDTGAAVVAFGRSESITGFNGVLRSGNTSNLFPYSTPDSVDLLNFGRGNVNFYLEAGDSGIGTGSYFWHRKTTSRLMTLTYDGKLGIGKTNPDVSLDVVGIITCTSIFADADLSVSNNATIEGDLSVNGILTLGSIVLPPTITSNLIGNVNTTTGISTFNKVRALSNVIAQGSLGVGIIVEASTLGVPFIVNDPQLIQNVFGVTYAGEVLIGTSDNFVSGINSPNRASTFGAIGVGTTALSCAVDFTFAGREVTGEGGVGITTQFEYMRVPRVTTDERNNFLGLIGGEIVYNTTVNRHQGYDGTTWNNLY